MLGLVRLNRRALMKAHCSEIIKDVLNIADDLKIFCSDIDVLGAKSLVDQMMTATFLKSTRCICYLNNSLAARY